MKFSELEISKPILKALLDKNYLETTAIQQEAIPHILEGKDLLGIAQTGTGKTAAFAIPIIEQICNGPLNKDIKALILTPTRELALQIEESFRDYSKNTSLRFCSVFGGVKAFSQIRKLRKGVDVLIATPGRLLDLLSQKQLSLKNIKHFILDEADRMLDMGFIRDINRVLTMIPKKRQTLFFSATMPKDIVKLSKTILNQAVRVEVKPNSSVVDKIEQQLYFVEKGDKANLLLNILRKDKSQNVLVFSRTKHGSDKIAKRLSSRGIPCDSIHGNKSQNMRERALSNFKSGKTRVIIATDIVARGIDINNLSMVINYDLPEMAETYVHRIGRTGRADNSGIAISFCAKEEKSRLRDIQKLTGHVINPVRQKNRSCNAAS